MTARVGWLLIFARLTTDVEAAIAPRAGSLAFPHGVAGLKAFKANGLPVGLAIQPESVNSSHPGREFAREPGYGRGYSPEHVAGPILGGATGTA